MLLKERSVFEYFIPHSSEENKNSTAICYFQSQRSTEDIKFYGLNFFLFIMMRHYAFQMLRTKEQLGYIVMCAPLIIHKMLGGAITVHSPKKDPDYLVHRINVYLEEQKVRFDNLTDEDFEKNKQSIITMKSVKDIKLSEAANRAWNEVYNELYMFDRQEREIEAIKNITKQELVNYFNETIYTNCRRINVKIICKNHTENPEVEAKELNQKYYEENCLSVIDIDPENIQEFQEMNTFQT